MIDLVLNRTDVNNWSRLIMKVTDIARVEPKGLKAFWIRTIITSTIELARFVIHVKSLDLAINVYEQGRMISPESRSKLNRHDEKKINLSEVYLLTKSLTHDSIKIKKRS